ncbi:SDR family NAD(P)-dependent oxidoreductase [Haloplanus aerogenes]|uniref:SDR family NAD(P)-dependent oxidoreductase n=1 Tax=Haloplanus aerogenes TaxID=660522 RepID=UPI00131466B4|nr:SDR family oxidoreductase [Haloplanus aerogenes]
MTAPISGPTDLSGTTAVVTGAAGAIGRATCDALAREGADVVATDVTDDGLAEAAARVEAHGRDATTVQADVTDPDAVARLRDRATDAGDVGIVATVHGIVSRTDLTEMTLDDWRTQIDVNLTGTMLVVQAFYDDLRDREYGKIVCVGSVAGQVGGVISGPNYVASKAGVHGFVRWVARNGAPDGVYANAVAPGPVWSPMTENEPGYDDEMTPLNRLGEPEDIAEAIVFLSGQGSNWITGTVLDVNGGISIG